MRHLIAIFFILLLSSQILPLKEVGKVLFKSQTTEEIHTEDIPAPDSDELMQLFTVPTHNTTFLNRVQLLSHVIAVYIHAAESLPDYHLPEILTPPPNRIHSC